jgi:hypothetical protein
MQPSEGDPIDLCSDDEAAIAPQPKQGPQDHIVNVEYHPNRRTPGAYPREQKPAEPYSGYSGLKSVSQESENFRKEFCDGDGLSTVIQDLHMNWAYGLGSFGAPRFADEVKPFLNALIDVLHLVFSRHG